MDAKHLTHEELRLLYQVTDSDLTYFKTQQWSLTNYTLLLLAALVATAQILKPNITSIERLALGTLALLVAIGALIVLSKLQQSIHVRQSRLDAIRDGFSSAFNLAWAAEVKGREYLHAVHFLRAAVVGGGLLVCWLVYRV